MQDTLSITIIYFLYGLAFFSMGLLVATEGGRSSDERVRTALRPLAGFGLVHAAHEWTEMFEYIIVQNGGQISAGLQIFKISTLAFSFLSLAAFGTFLLARGPVAQRISLLVPLGLEAIWVFGMITIKDSYAPGLVYDAAHAWTRYSLAIPASILAALGLIAQQRAFRRVGMVRFGQDAMWAAVAFAWYGLVGQLFINASALPPSNVVNGALFQEIFNFPIQMFRAIVAGVASIYVIRFLRAFQVETDQKIAELQADRLKEAQQREAMRGELFRRVVAAQESERQRIARDLHDETGQALTAIGMGLRGLESRLERDPGEASATLHELQTLTADSLQELQRLMTDLRPSHLDDLGLPAALRWYAARIEERYPLKVRVDVSGPESPIDEAAKTASFRIVQEAFNNIIKHAEAQTVQIDLTFEERGMRVTVRDDGRGFDLGRIRIVQSSSRPSLGLAGMQERVALLGGAFSIQTSPGHGTAIEAFIPYHHEEDSPEEESPLP